MNEVRFAKWNNLDAVCISNDYADGIITLMGAHVVSYTPKGSKDILWLSKKSNYIMGKAIRGGVPVCWPWFGKAALPGHGIARLAPWTVVSASTDELGGTKVVFSYRPAEKEFSFLTAKMTVTMGKNLKMELETTNEGTADFVLGEAFHTYFNVGGIKALTVSGLDGVMYLDNLAGLKEVTQKGDINFTAETDRVYFAKGTVFINDPEFGRKIKIEKSGSNNTVVWNPWIEKSISMPDFEDSEYTGMVCVEAANAFAGRVTLAPGKSNTMTCVISEVK